MVDLENENPYKEITSRQKDGADSYLILSEENHDGLPYQINMIRYNNIEGLLKVEFLIENRTYHYYYDISLKESLYRKMKSKKYTLAHIRTIMTGLYRLTENLSEYLLDINSVILHPDYIFTDRDFKRVWFCFYPEQNSGFEKNLELLFEYFMDHLDYSEDRNVRIAYGLYQKVREENCSLEEIMSVFQEIDDLFERGEEEEEEIPDHFYDHEEDFAQDRKVKEPPASKKLYLKLPGYITKLPVFLAFVCASLYLFSVKFSLKRMDYAVILLLSLGLYLLICSFREEKKGGMKETQPVSKYEKPEHRNRTDLRDRTGMGNQTDLRDRTGMGNQTDLRDRAGMRNQTDMGDLTGRGERTGMGRTKRENKMSEYDLAHEARQKEIRQKEIRQREEEYESFIYDPSEPEFPKKAQGADKIPATVILSADLAKNAMGVLVSKDREIADDIPLEKESLLIGKLPGVADIILNVSTISRIHARIIKEENKHYLLDLGSSNGTFVNGRKIREREKVLLSPKDCISFANVEFEYEW